MPKKNDGKVYLSPSSLQHWFEYGCPARWKLEKDYEPKIENEFATRGKLVHSMLDGSVSVGLVTDRLALAFYSKIDTAFKTSGMTTVENEIPQSFEILPDIVWVRRIDRIAVLPDDTPVIVDFKTTGAIWKELKNGIIPQALAFQGPGYTTPPPPDMWTKTPWPATLFYLVSGFKGPASFIRYEATEELTDNFLNSVRMAADAISRNRFPKIYGKHCLECPVAAACFNDPKWKRSSLRKR